MIPKVFFFAITAMMTFIVIACVASETSWASKENGTETLRQLVGLPSIATGNLNPSARNPGVEVFCTSLYDLPGGYCYYYTLGLPFTNYTIYSNITIGER